MFGIPTVITVFFYPQSYCSKIPDVIFTSDFFTLSKSVLIIDCFAIVMIVSSIKMIRPSKAIVSTTDEKLNYFRIGLQVCFIGLISGFVGAGGGF